MSYNYRQLLCASVCCAGDMTSACYSWLFIFSLGVSCELFCHLRCVVWCVSQRRTKSCQRNCLGQGQPNAQSQSRILHSCFLLSSPLALVVSLKMRAECRHSFLFSIVLFFFEFYCCIQWDQRRLSHSISSSRSLCFCSIHNYTDAVAARDEKLHSLFCLAFSAHCSLMGRS